MIEGKKFQRGISCITASNDTKASFLPAAEEAAVLL